jgi:glycosyltransferase involved in cell wall biosynthesis
MKTAKKKTVIIVAPYFPPHLGGAERYAYNIAQGLKTYGWNVVIVTTNHDTNTYKEETVGGLKLYRLKRWFRLSNSPVNPLWYFQIKKIIQKESPKVIIAHTPVPFMADIAARASGKIPFILTYHAASLYKQNNPMFNGLISLYYTFVEKETLRKAEKIFAISAYVKEKLPHDMQDKILVVANSISRREIMPIRTQKKRNNTLVFLASLDKTHSWKGLDVIIRSIDVYIKKYSKDIELIVVGDGNYKTYYENLARELGIAKYITFTGAQFGKNKLNILRKAKILITYPKTSNDAFPTVFLEAWANLVAILSSDIEPIPHVLTHKKNGYLVKSNSAEELAKGIRNLIGDEKLLSCLIKNGWGSLKNYILEDKVRQTNTYIEAVYKK